VCASKTESERERRREGRIGTGTMSAQPFHKEILKEGEAVEWNDGDKVSAQLSDIPPKKNTRTESNREDQRKG
jgi:hypothetical protein